MIDHVSVGVCDLERAALFYQVVLGAVGYQKLVVRPRTVGFGKRYPEFWVNLRAAMPPVADHSGAHVGLRVRGKEMVDAFHSAALAAGGACDGAPGLRPQHGEGYYAAFIRGQITLAAAADWEPVAVANKHRRPDWVSGQPWRHLLPPLSPIAAEWHPDRPFRRGLGWCVVVRDLTAFLQIADALFDAAPVGELPLPTAARSEWQRFAAQRWLPRVRAVRFYGIGLPIEPVRQCAFALSQ